MPALKAATGAPTYGYFASATPVFTPDIPLHDNDVVAGWTALYTPGHAADHLCFARDGVVLTADHIMSWSTSIVSPPQGNMTQYFASLRRMLAREDALYLPGHGPAIPDPARYGNFLLQHRLQREAAIGNALATGPQTPGELVLALYVDLKPALRPAAERSVLAHLHKLRDDGVAREDGGVWVRCSSPWPCSLSPSHSGASRHDGADGGGYQRRLGGGVWGSDSSGAARGRGCDSSGDVAIGRGDDCA